MRIDSARHRRMIFTNETHFRPSRSAIVGDQLAQHRTGAVRAAATRSRAGEDGQVKSMEQDRPQMDRQNEFNGGHLCSPSNPNLASSLGPTAQMLLRITRSLANRVFENWVPVLLEARLEPLVREDAERDRTICIGGYQ